MRTVEHVTTANRGSTHDVTRLLVTRQDPTSMYRPLGFLEAHADVDGVEYTFAYLRRAVAAPGFRPLVGMPQVRRYVSRGLFPLFAERLMDPRRPDRADYLAALDLGPDASPLLVLSRSGGHRAGDAVELSPVPSADADGRSSCVFLVHGIRHMPGSDAALDSLEEGDELALMPQPENRHNARALLVSARDSAPVGWVPDVLLDYVHGLAQPVVRVVRVNGPDVGSRLRLLVRVDGGAVAGWAPFSGPDWDVVDG
ncbi:hypothetical protein [uncultured Pseudokineococcus sp.]|uniref:hypothetical protein n=1 Tax=uncultured Pseudokineococcus sp. TaxID=1642928 RepID=UPI00261D0214|nr:hypothetical protein [uncultured Pseudokineococcus sp.]